MISISFYRLSFTVDAMDLLYYSLAPLILFCVLYTLNYLPYYLSIANGAGGVGILNFSYFIVLYRSYQVNNQVNDVLYILMYYYSETLQCNMKGGIYTEVYLQETCSDAHERSGTNKLIWDCCISYSMLIFVVFGSLKSRGGQFQQIEMDVDFVISSISSMFNDNW